MSHTKDEVNDFPAIYARGNCFEYSDAIFSVGADDDVSLHASRSGIGGLFAMTPTAARALAAQLEAAADAVDLENLTK